MVEANERYEVQVIKATFGSTKGQEETDEQEGKAKRPVVTLSLEVVGDPLAYPIFERLYFPIEGDKDSTIQMLNERIKQAFVALGFNPAQHGDIKPNDFQPGMQEMELPGWKGMRGWAIIGIHERNDDTEENFVKKWVTES